MPKVEKVYIYTHTYIIFFFFFFYQRMKQSRAHLAYQRLSSSSLNPWRHNSRRPLGHEWGNRVNTSWRFKATTQKAFLSWPRPHTQMEHSSLLHTHTHIQYRHTQRCTHTAKNNKQATEVCWHYAAANIKSISRRYFWNSLDVVFVGLVVAVRILKGRTWGEGRGASPLWAHVRWQNNKWRYTPKCMDLRVCVCVFWDLMRSAALFLTV